MAAVINASGAPTLLQAISGAHTDTKATTANANEPSTLRHHVIDYVVHLRHHLRQILG